MSLKSCVVVVLVPPSAPEIFENIVFTLKTEKFVNVTITGHFFFFFKEKLGKEITRFS